MQTIAVRLLIALPWLISFNFGPSTTRGVELLTLACGMMLMIVALAHSPFPLAKSTASAWLLAGTLSCAMALVQYLGWSAHFSPFISATLPGEAFANLRQRNLFATLTSIALAALLWWSLQLRPERSRRRSLVCTGMAALAVLLAVGNAASSSRTGLFQVVLVCALTALWRGFRVSLTRRLLAVYVLAYAIALLVLPTLIGLNPLALGAWARLQAGDALCSGRSTLWHNVLDLIAQKPWLGWGWGELDYAHYVTLFPGERFCAILDNAHNLPLHLAVELGVPFAVCFCLALLWLTRRARPWAEVDATRQMAWCVLAVIALHSLLEYPLWYGPFQMAVVLCGVLLWITPERSLMCRNPVFESNRQLVQSGCAIAAIIFIVFVGYASWDYYRISQIYLSPHERSAAYRDDTLRKIKGSRLFQAQVEFAELAITPLTPDNAREQYRMATALLHFSPEPLVIERVIASAGLLGMDAEVAFHRARYQAAFPEVYLAWQARPQNSPTSPRASPAASHP